MTLIENAKKIPKLIVYIYMCHPPKKKNKIYLFCVFWLFVLLQTALEDSYVHNSLVLLEKRCFFAESLFVHVVLCFKATFLLNIYLFFEKGLSLSCKKSPDTQLLSSSLSL